MRKLLLLTALFALVALNGASQGLLSPVPDNLFTQTTDRALNQRELVSQWIPRLQAGITGVSYYRNKETKQIERADLNAICFGISWLHYKPVEGLPFNDFGINIMLLQNVIKAGMGIGVYGTYNTGAVGLLNLGTHYDFPLKLLMLDTGLSFHF